MTQKRMTSSTLRRILSVLLCLCMTLSLIPMTALAEDPSDAGGGTQTGQHITALKNVLINGGLGDETKWTQTLANAGSSFTFDSTKDSVSVSGWGTNNAITWKGNELKTATNLLVQFDILPPDNTHAESGKDADDFKVRILDDGNGNRLQVRLQFSGPNIGVEVIDNSEAGTGKWGWYAPEEGDPTTPTRTAFTWEPGKTYPVDILVQDGNVKVYWNGEKLIDVPLTEGWESAMGPGALSFASQWGQQNHTISNLKVTTDEDVNVNPPASEKEQVKTPAITAANGQVIITCETAGANIYYTTDGSAPTKESTAYAAPFPLTETATVKAIAVKDGMDDSEVAKEKVEISTGGHLDALQYPLMTGFGGGTDWTNGDTLRFSVKDDALTAVKNATAETIIKYQYNNVVDADNFLIQYDWTINEQTNVQFRTRFKIDGPGNYVQVRFHTNNQTTPYTESVWVGIFNGSDAATLTEEKIGEFSLPVGGTAKIDIKVEGDTITVYKDGGKIGSCQNAKFNMAAGAFAFASSYQHGYTVSNLKITTADNPEAQLPRVETPEISETNGLVTITCETADAEIYYTIDGSDPSKESTKYTGPFPLDETATVNAIAVKEDMKDSVIASKYIVVAPPASHKDGLLNGTIRTLLPTSALDGPDSWDLALANANSSITIANGKARLKTGGPNNRMGYKANAIKAKKFLISFDYTVLDGSNTNTKVAFKSAASFDGDRLQVRFNPTPAGRTISIERGTSGGATWSETRSFTWVTGQTYGIDILVNGDTITVYVNGEKTISKQHSDIAVMDQGYFSISTQYPTGDVTFENLSITTDEQPKGDRYTVTLETATDGVRGDAAGGKVTADSLNGYEDDIISLQVTPAHNYVFDHWESYITEDNSSTDGLMPINNNAFTLNSKFGDVTVVACFVTRTPGRFELHYDDFIGHDGYKYDIATGQRDYITHYKDEGGYAGYLTIDASTGNYNFLKLKDEFKGTYNDETIDWTLWEGRLDGEGFRISVDAWKADNTTGTMQIMFKGLEDFNRRYVLALNGTEAFIRHINSETGQNTMLANTKFAFTTKKVHLVLEVVGNTVTFIADGSEVLKYTYNASKDHENHWTEAPDRVSLINMTPGAPVCFDNLLVERIPNEIPIELVTNVLDNGVEKADADHAAGTLVASAASGVEGDTIKLAATPKAGYALERIYVKDHDGITVTDNVFTIPSNISGKLTVVAVFKAADMRAGRDFHIDSVGGNDSGDGTIDHPWKTLGKLADYTATAPLVPGDRVLLKRGSEFNGEQLNFQGMGSKSAPVTVTAYGDGSLPRLNGQGAVEDVVYLYNQEYVTLSDLEITNTSSKYTSNFSLNSSTNKSLALRGVRVVAKDFGVVSGIKILNCYFHDINGNISLKWNGGIFFDVQADVVNGGLTGVPTKYDDVLIEGCTFINVDRSGIKLVNSAWCNQWEPNNRTLPVNWYPSTNVVVRNNYLEKIGGDGITTRDTDGALIEYNLTKDCRYQDTGYNVAIWPFQAANTVIQYNETYNTHSTQDGQGLDCDHASSYSLMQYNYSHNNEGGFMLIMGGYPHTAATVRYNISQNDCDKAFEFAQGLPMGTMIYNNTLYSDKIVGKGIMYLSNTANGRGINDFYVFNNLFIYPAGQPFYGNQVADLKSHIKIYNNAYVNGISAPDEDELPITVASVDEVLVNAGSGPEVNYTKEPAGGKTGELDGYRLTENSELINMGVTMKQAITYFSDNDSFQVFDGRALSPRELEDLYYDKGESSLKYVMGENFPEVRGAAYDKDFFGGSNRAEGVPDIGAAEYQR